MGMHWGLNWGGGQCGALQAQNICKKTLHHTTTSQQLADLKDFFRHVKIFYTSKKIAILLNNSVMLRNV